MSASVKVLLVALVAAHVASYSLVLANPLLSAQRYRREISQHLSQSYIQQTGSGPCQQAGHTSGCCNPVTPNSCITSSSCYCDLSCYLYDDCCQDIGSINCSRPAHTACPDVELDHPANGISVSYSHDPKRPGTVAHFTCDDDDNFALVGNSVRVCQHNLTWGGSPPQCRKTCDELGTLTNGRITYEPPYSTSSRKPLRTVATYSCNEGYVLNLDIRKRVCEEVEDSQGWSGASDTSSAQCIARSCQLAEFRGNRNVKSCCREPIRYYCTIGPPQSDVECSCSLLTCIAEGNCCPDIDRECVPETCSEAGLPNNGCCSWENSEGCYVPGGNCYCDQECHRWNDCCPGVGNCTTSSSSRAASQIYIGHESVRTKLYSAQARLASQRLRGGQKSRKFDDQAVVRELASELRSMSQVQELSNQQQRAQWETILSELQEIQKTKN